MAETLLALKAGRAFRREGTNFVDPSPTKGALILTNSDDGLLHLLWRNRETNQVEEDLILVPMDASFVKVSQSDGRVYVLKFSSSNQRHFFWFQDASSARDEEFVNNINGLLQDPDYNVVWSSQGESSRTQLVSASSQDLRSEFAPPEQGSLGIERDGTEGIRATPEQIARLRNLVESISAQNPSTPPDMSLTDILTPANLNPLFESHPDLIPALFPHLPPDLPMPPSRETLQRIITSPQFRAALQNLDQALRTGLLSGLMRGLGLPDEAGTSVEAFLRAIQQQANRDSQPSMETD